MSKDRVNLLKGHKMQLSNVFSNAKDIIIIVGIGLALFFGYQAFFGGDGLKQLLQNNKVEMKSDLKVLKLKIDNSNKKLDSVGKEVKTNLEAVQTTRLRSGTYIREIYIPNMRRYGGESVEEAFKSFDSLCTRNGLSAE